MSEVHFAMTNVSSSLHFSLPSHISCATTTRLDSTIFARSTNRIKIRFYP